MFKILVVLCSILIFCGLYLSDIHNLFTLSLIMLTHFNGIPAPTWIIMNTSYTYGPELTVPIMSTLWFINSTLFFYYWRWVIYYRKDRDVSEEYIQSLTKKSENNRFYKFLLKGITTNLKWYYVALIRLIPTPFSSNLLLCASLKKTTMKNFMLGNAIAILITTTYFAYMIDIVKMSKIPTLIKNMIYIFNML